MPIKRVATGLKRWLHVRAFQAGLREFGSKELIGMQVSDQSAVEGSGLRERSLLAALSNIADNDPVSYQLLRETIAVILVGEYKNGPRFVEWTRALLVPREALERQSPTWLASLFVQQATAAHLAEQLLAPDHIARISLGAQIQFLKSAGEAPDAVKSLKRKGLAQWPDAVDLFGPSD